MAAYIYIVTRQLVSGYLDIAEKQAECEIPMMMNDWAKHLDGVLTSIGENGYMNYITKDIGW